MILYNEFNIQARAWFVNGSYVVVEPGCRVPNGAIMLTIRSLNRNVLFRRLLLSHAKDSTIIQPTPRDVKSGRGSHSRNHPGNIWQTRLIEDRHFATEYALAASPQEKRSIIDEILNMMAQHECRILKLAVHDRRLGIWKWIVEPNPRSKIAQKLRDMNRDDRRRAQQQPRAAPVAIPALIDPQAPMNLDALFDDDGLGDEYLRLFSDDM